MTEGHTPDLIERCREPLPKGMCEQGVGCNAANICLCSAIEDQRETLTEAADEITALRARVAEFCEAMEYAAGCDEGVDEDTATSEIMSWAGSPMAVAYTNARSILSRAQQGGGEK